MIKCFCFWIIYDVGVVKRKEKLAAAAFDEVEHVPENLRDETR